MTAPNVRGEPATEVLDLYDDLPERGDALRDTARPTEDDPVTSMIKGTGRNLTVIMGMFALSLAAFIACATLFSLGVALLVLVVANDDGAAVLRRDLAPAYPLSGRRTRLPWEAAAPGQRSILA